MSEQIIDYFSGLVCDPSRQLNRPFYVGKKVGIASNAIAICWDVSDIQDGWIDANSNESALRILNACSQQGSPVDAAIPDIAVDDRWRSPYQQLKSKCPECHGIGIVECDYGHEHECPECGGSGYASWYSSETAIAAYYSNTKGEDRYLELPGVGLFDKRYLWILSQLIERSPHPFKFSKASFSGGINLLFSSQGLSGVLMSVLVRR